MNELEVEEALNQIAEDASPDPAFLRSFPALLMSAYQASPSQIARLVKDNEARAAKADLNTTALTIEGIEGLRRPEPLPACAPAHASPTISLPFGWLASGTEP